MRKFSVYNNMAMVAFGVLSLVLVSCIKDDGQEPGAEKIKPGDKLPAFSVVMDDGREVSSEDLSGKVSVIVFFNTLCPDCQKELPVVQKVYEHYAGDSNIEFLAISRGEAAESVSEYWNDNGLTLPFSAQKDNAVYELFSVYGIPRIYISDVGGTVRYVHSDVDMPTYEILSKEIENVRFLHTSHTEKHS